MIEFDPRTVDVTDDPEYQARANTPGPSNKLMWSFDDAARGKQLEMLEIDRDMHAKWDAVMVELIDRNLSDAEFTTERMLRLRLWTKERKRRQHNLHYKYDPTRRRKDFVERDVEKMRAKLADLKAQLDARRNAATTEAPAPDALRAPKRTPVRPGQRREKQPIDPNLDPGLLEMIVTDTGVDDITTATDAEILNAYKAIGWNDYSAEYYLATLRGRPVPERPVELG